MPPRKKPVAGAPLEANAYGDPIFHLQPFVDYQTSECGMSANTVVAYRGDLVQFIDWFRAFGPKSLHAVELRTFTGYLQFLHERGLAPSSIARKLVALKMFFRFLLLEGIIQQSKADLLSSPKLWQRLPHVLSPEKVDQLLAAPTAGEDLYPCRDRAVLALLYATGCRASEVASLRLRDLHLADNYCRVIGKGNKERLVSLNPVARLALETYLEHERPRLVPHADSESLLLSRRGRPFNRIMVWHLVKRYARRIGASATVSPHTLRHSFATHLLAGGAEIRALQELLGHASIATTQLYTQVEHSRLKAIHRRCHPRG